MVNWEISFSLLLRRNTRLSRYLCRRCRSQRSEQIRAVLTVVNSESHDLPVVVDCRRGGDVPPSTAYGIENALEIKYSAFPPEHQFLLAHRVETSVRTKCAPAQSLTEIVDPRGAAHVIAGQ